MIIKLLQVAWNFKQENTFSCQEACAPKIQSLLTLHPNTHAKHGAKSCGRKEIPESKTSSWKQNSQEDHSLSCHVVGIHNVGRPQEVHSLLCRVVGVHNVGRPVSMGSGQLWSGNLPEVGLCLVRQYLSRISRWVGQIWIGKPVWEEQHPWASLLLLGVQSRYRRTRRECERWQS